MLHFRGAEQLMKIRIGHLSTFYHTAVLLMAQGDADARLGAETEWKLMGTGPEIMKAFLYKKVRGEAARPLPTNITIRQFPFVSKPSRPSR